MGKRLFLKLAIAMTVLATVILLALFWFGQWLAGGEFSAADIAEEIDRRGWRVIYWNEGPGNRVVAVCDAGQNRLAVVDTDWQTRGFSAFNVGDSEHHGISAGGFEVFGTEGWSFQKKRFRGCMVRIKVPRDGYIRIVHQAGYHVQGTTKSGGEILLDVEVDWNAGEPIQKRH